MRGGRFFQQFIICNDGWASLAFFLLDQRQGRMVRYKIKTRYVSRESLVGLLLEKYPSLNEADFRVVVCLEQLYDLKSVPLTNINMTDEKRRLHIQRAV